MVGERRVAATRTLGSFPVGTTSRSLMEVGGGGGREEGEEGRRGRKGGGGGRKEGEEGRRGRKGGGGGREEGEEGRRGRNVYEWEDVEV